MYLRKTDGGKILLSGDYPAGSALVIEQPPSKGGSSGESKAEISKAIADRINRQRRHDMQVSQKKKSRKQRRRENKKFNEIIAPVIREIDLSGMEMPERRRESMIKRLMTTPPGFSHERLRQHLEKVYQLEVEMKRRREAAADEQEAIALILLSMN